MARGSARLTELASLQVALLRAGFRVLRPGGALIYSTCSFARAQNEDIVAQLLHEQPRAKLLRFVEWCCSEAGRTAGCPSVDRRRVHLLGFSDGATTAVELATTRRFRSMVVCAYGFTGELPTLAAQRLSGVPMWCFHSADDVIFSVENSDRLVRTLRQAGNDEVRYSRFERDQEGFTGRVRGHSTGITASKDPEVYRWLLAQNSEALMSS